MNAAILRNLPVRLLLLGALATVFSGCQPKHQTSIPGYVEGDYVYVAAPVGGRLIALPVQRGQSVSPGDPLFELEPEPEATRLQEAQTRVVNARAILADLRKGRRPSEIQSLQAQLAEAESALTLANAESQRQIRLSENHVTSPQERDRVEATARQAGERVRRLRADLTTAEVGARSDQIAAAEAEVATLEAAVARAEWERQQKQPRAIQAAPVHDTLYRVGEWVPAGKPVVVLLPAPQIKIRIFVSEARLGTLQVGAPATVEVDGTRTATAAHVSFISTHAEYTPPVLFSRDNRTQLVYLVELALAPADAPRFHPGQPVDVTFLTH